MASDGLDDPGVEPKPDIPDSFDKGNCPISLLKLSNQLPHHEIELDHNNSVYYCMISTK